MSDRELRSGTPPEGGAGVELRCPRCAGPVVLSPLGCPACLVELIASLEVGPCGDMAFAHAPVVLGSGLALHTTDEAELAALLAQRPLRLGTGQPAPELTAIHRALVVQGVPSRVLLSERPRAATERPRAPSLPPAPRPLPAAPPVATTPSTSPQPAASSAPPPASRATPARPERPRPARPAGEEAGRRRKRWSWIARGVSLVAILGMALVAWVAYDANLPPERQWAGRLFAWIRPARPLSPLERAAERAAAEQAAAERASAERRAAKRAEEERAADPSAEDAADTSTERMLQSTVLVRSGDSVGTGFVVVRKGLVLTNRHVLGERAHVGDRVTIELGSVIDRGTVAAISSRFDLALLSCKEQSPCADLKPLEAGQAAQVQVGAAVRAVGSPAGLDRTLTRGIISHRGRLIEGVAYLQTDLAVNPGNSGGPLVDDSGRVVGVVTAKLSSAEGIAFALPIEYALTGRDALLGPYLRDAQRSYDYSPAMSKLIREARPLEGAVDRRPKRRAGDGEATVEGPGVAASDELVLREAWCDYRAYMVKFRLTVPASDKLSGKENFFLLANGNVIELGHVTPHQTMEREADSTIIYDFEYVGMIVGGSFSLGTGTKLKVRIGDRYESQELQLRQPAFNIRLN